MIKDILKRREESDTYLTRVCRYVLAESSEYIHFHRDLSAPSMSTDMSQVGVTLFPSF